MYVLEYSYDDGRTWDYPGEPSACVFPTEADADIAGGDLLERCPEYRQVHLRVVHEGRTVTRWAPCE